MNWSDLEKHFSTPRLGRYLVAYNGDNNKAALAYSHNLMLSEAMVPALNVLEIALRNGIHQRLTALYGRPDWWTIWPGNQDFNWQCGEVSKAIAKLVRRKEPQTPDKIVAELTFGFWCSLFNSKLQTHLWKDLRLVFARCPKQQRQRHKVSTLLNQIRDLRNRVFHHEPLLWLSPSLSGQHSLTLQAIAWLDPQLVAWLGQHDRLPASWVAWQAVPP